MPAQAVEVRSLSYSYKEQQALSGISLDVPPGEIFGLLGPNGSGKSTLFRILSTLLPTAANTVQIFGQDVTTARDAVREQIGVVFQSPSIDVHLTARENLRCHGALYGMSREMIRSRADELLSWVKLSHRADERAKTFSGGMRRRVELAKSMLHRPRLLIMDEPSTGLDPAARLDLWELLLHLRGAGTTVLLTTHLMDEAERCDRVAIMDEGRVVALDAPALLKNIVGGDVISIATREPERFQAMLRDKLQIEDGKLVPGSNVIHLERPRGHELVPRIIEAAPGLVDSISVGRPTLEDVFLHLTGRQFGRP